MKKPDKPAPTGPCDCKKVVKGWYCEMCKRELKEDDVRNSVCKKCETKPEQIEFCLKRTYHPQTAEEIRKKLPPKFTDDLARIGYECDTCAAKGQVEKDIKHKDDCKPKFGGGLKKVCAKSGKAPHATDAK
jgi:hypothetical protein